MTDAERKLLIWCAEMLLRSPAAPMTIGETDILERLISEVRAPPHGRLRVPILAPWRWNA